MSTADVHAVVLLVLVASTIGFVAVAGGRPTLRRLLVALPLTTLFWLFHAATGLHRCRSGAPWREGVIAAVCLFVVLLLVKTPSLRVTGALFVASAFGALAVHFLGMVHDDGWVANRGAPRDVVQTNQSMLQKVRRKAVRAGKRNANLSSPAGWLCKTPAIAKAIYPHRPVPLVLARIKVSTVWHSSFTGLLQTTPTFRGLWYPGGPLGQAGPAIDLRDGGPKECAY